MSVKRAAQRCRIALAAFGIVSFWLVTRRLVGETPRSFSLAALPSSEYDCLQRSGLAWVTMNDSTGWTVMSTVEAHTYPSGIQARCDMVVGSRFTRFQPSLAKHAWLRTARPQTVFVRNDLLPKFIAVVLPCLTHRFVLLLGDSDLTLPRQVDVRFPKIMPHAAWLTLLADERLAHVFVENLDQPHPKVSGLPLGVSPYNLPGRSADVALASAVPASGAITAKPLRALHMARMRDGKGQWADRAAVHRLCQTAWGEVCEAANVTDREGMWAAMQAVPFVLCSHGGGLDPSPKAWEALALGSIPIMAHFAGDDAYTLLPVVFVDSWHDGSLTQASLRRWLAQLAPWFTQADKRAEVLRRLGSQFWWSRVVAAQQGRLPQWLAANPRIAIEWRPEPRWVAVQR